MSGKALAVVMLTAASACNGPPSATLRADADVPVQAPFVAFASTFQGFRRWTSFHSDGPPAGSLVRLRGAPGVSARSAADA